MYYPGIHGWLRDDATNSETTAEDNVCEKQLDYKNRGSEESGQEEIELRVEV